MLLRVGFEGVGLGEFARPPPPTANAPGLLEASAFPAVLAGSLGGRQPRSLPSTRDAVWATLVGRNRLESICRNVQSVPRAPWAVLRGCLGCWLGSCRALGPSPALAQKGELSGQWQFGLSSCGFAIAHPQARGKGKATPCFGTAGTSVGNTPERCCNSRSGTTRLSIRKGPLGTWELSRVEVIPAPSAAASHFLRHDQQSRKGREGTAFLSRVVTAPKTPSTLSSVFETCGARQRLRCVAGRLREEKNAFSLAAASLPVPPRPKLRPVKLLYSL